MDYMTKSGKEGPSEREYGRTAYGDPDCVQPASFLVEKGDDEDAIRKSNPGENGVPKAGSLG